MADYSYVPVDYQPDFSEFSFIPVDHDPFSADGAAQQARTQLASQPQRLATSDAPVPGNENVAVALANQQQPTDTVAPEPTGGVSGAVGTKIKELASDFYNQSILKPARDIRDMGHDLVTDPGYFLHAIGPSLVGLGMSAPTIQIGVGPTERAKEIHGVLSKIEQTHRTTAVLETDIGRIIAGGTRDLKPLQRAILGRGEIAAKDSHAHAEITALDKAAIRGAVPSKLAVTRAICPQCAAVIESRGGRLTSPTTAVFLRR